MSSFDFGPYIAHTYGEEVDREYRSRLGWITGSVEASIAWPQKDVLVIYQGEKYFLRGIWEREKETAPCITMPLDREGPDSLHEALAKMYRFTSILGWYLNGYVDVTGYITGSGPVTYGVWADNRKPTVMGNERGFNCNYLPVIKDEKTRRALAFWREGERLRRIHPGYAFLAYYKVIESGINNGRRRGEWIDKNIAGVTGDALKRVDELRLVVPDVGKHLQESGRHAMAHARSGSIDPDVPADRLRISADLVVMGDLAFRYIHDELAVPTHMDTYRFRDRLTALYAYLPEEQIKRLRERGSIPRRRVSLAGLKVNLGVWPEKPPAQLCDLQLTVNSAIDGVLSVTATSSDECIYFAFAINFAARRANPDLFGTGHARSATRPQAKAVLQYLVDTIGNGRVELTFPSGEVLQCEVYIAENVDVGRTVDNWRRMMNLLDD